MDRENAYQIKKILLAADDSPYSEGAIREAISLAVRLKSQLIFVSVLLVNVEEGSVLGARRSSEEAVHRHANLVRQQAEQAGVPCKVIVRRADEAAEAIALTAKDQEADVIVMGRRNRSGLMRLMTGSVSAQVIGQTAGNVLVVPRAAHVEFKRIIVATDGSVASQIAVRWAVELARKTDATVQALLVGGGENPPPHWRHYAQESVDSAIAIGERQGISIGTVIFAGKPADTIIEQSKNLKADLIVVGTHARRGLEKLLVGSVSEKVIANGECAVWVGR